MAEARRVFQRRIEKQRKDDKCRLEDANGKRNEWEDRRTVSVLAWTVARRSSDSDGGPWPLYKMKKRHRKWTILLHASVGRYLMSWLPMWRVNNGYCDFQLRLFQYLVPLGSGPTKSQEKDFNLVPICAPDCCPCHSLLLNRGPTVLPECCARKCLLIVHDSRTGHSRWQ